MNFYLKSINNFSKIWIVVKKQLHSIFGHINTAYSQVGNIKTAYSVYKSHLSLKIPVHSRNSWRVTSIFEKFCKLPKIWTQNILRVLNLQNLKVKYVSYRKDSKIFCGFLIIKVWNVEILLPNNDCKLRDK